MPEYRITYENHSGAQGWYDVIAETPLLAEQLFRASSASRHLRVVCSVTELCGRCHGSGRAHRLERVGAATKGDEAPAHAACKMVRDACDTCGGSGKAVRP